MKTPFPTSGLYVITKTAGLSAGQIVDSMTKAISGGAKVVQYRDKENTGRTEIAKALLQVCRTARIPFIVNDDVDLAVNINADGVHLGKTDCDIKTARVNLDNDAIIGVSCYDSLTQAQIAQDQGATYVAFGRFFPSNSKPNASYASPKILAQADLKIPIVAIGGITPQNGKMLIDAGADLLAVIDAVCGQNNPEHAAQQFECLFKNQARCKN